MIDKNTVALAIENMLKADTTTLYGAGKYLQIIESDQEKFENSKTDNNNLNALYVVCDIENNTQERQNSYEDYSVSLRFESLDNNIETAITNIDRVYERVKYLVNNQMWGGNMMRGYFTDSYAQIYNIETTDSVLSEPEKTNKLIIIEIESSIIVNVTRWNN